MSDAARTYYELLGVAADADGKAIRKAYFAKVREFPPETHPEPFKRVREAYEVLSDAATRRQYDETLAGGGEAAALRARLMEAIGAWERGELAAAQKQLAQLLLEQPGFTVARSLLARVFVADGKVKQAIPIYEALCNEEPANPMHQLHRGHAWRAGGDLERALEAYRRAYQLDRTDPETLLAVADCLADRKAYDEALAELDKAIQLDGKVDLDDLGYFLRKLQIEYLRDRPERADLVVDQIVAVLPGDLESRRLVASRLLAIAAGLFARGQHLQAQGLIGRARKIDPTRKSLKMEVPVRADVEIARLPTAARAWLRDAAKDPASVPLRRWPRTIWILCAVFYVWASAHLLFGARQEVGLGSEIFAFVHVVVGVFIASWLIRSVAWAVRSPYGQFMALHPFHVVHCARDTVTLLPLMNLRQVDAVHHRTNGRYQHSDVTFQVGEEKVSFEFQDVDVANRFGQRALDQRRRILQLMASNLLEQEKGYDLFPAALLEGRDQARSQALATRAHRTRQATQVAIALGLVVLAIPYNRRATERLYFQKADAAGIREKRSYLRLYPNGRFSDEVRTAIGARYDELSADYRKVARLSAPGVAGMNALFGLLRDGPSSRVVVRYEGRVELDDPSRARAVADPRPSFSAESNRRREAGITAALRTALAQAIPPEALELVADGEPGDPPSASFVMRYRVGSSGTVYVEQSTGQQLAGVLYDWDFAIHAGVDGEKLHELHFQANPASHIRYTTDARDRPTPAVAYAQMQQSAFESFQAHLLAQLGLADEVRDVPEPPAPAFPGLPYRPPTTPAFPPPIRR